VFVFTEYKEIEISKHICNQQLPCPEGFDSSDRRDVRKAEFLSSNSAANHSARRLTIPQTPTASISFLPHEQLVQIGAPSCVSQHIATGEAIAWLNSWRDRSWFSTIYSTPGNGLEISVKLDLSQLLGVSSL
jgi:hypothetical protein